ncbi:hypothetical protein GV828_03960 [Flavobacterium sp. NST-5]|uniref:Lipocalin-like domain-containing protein n=1 Tax=Flavobacterium ichthyis TaxID=2698827 RepID=A0ABW9Z678_9FLAO|nr:lipocalin family protein [Flavobacterium ichthyis]NBL64356.1 hypothetical protein [Flavobacterium ichthyis]
MKILNKTFATRFLMLFLFGIALSGFISCNNDDDQSEPSTMELLTSGRWYFQSSTIISITSCDRQEYFDFSEDGLLILFITEMVEGTCENQPLQNLNFELLSNNNLLLRDDAGNTNSLQIVAISQNTMVLRQIMDDGTNHDLTFDKTAG